MRKYVLSALTYQTPELRALLQTSKLFSPPLKPSLHPGTAAATKGPFEELLQTRELSPRALLQGRGQAVWEELVGAQTSRAASTQAAQHGATGSHHAIPFFNEPELCFEGLPSRVITYGIMVSSCTVCF